jgi:ATP-dependent protease HslVU (ClpYQ) peptidase subunit
MTAEVAIVNKSAVVVAADSAVTVGKSRVHRSSNKIFSLSDATPIGLVIFGQAEFAGMPWEIL